MWRRKYKRSIGPEASDGDEDGEVPPEELRQMWLEEVNEDILALRPAPSTIRADRDVVLAAVKKYGPALEYAADHLKADKAFVLTAVRENVTAWRFADEQVMEELMQDVGAAKELRQMWLKKVERNGWALQYAPKAIRSDEEMVLAAVNQCGLAFEFAAKHLKTDRDFVLAVVRQNITAWTCVHEQAKEEFMLDTEIAKEVAKEGKELGVLEGSQCNSPSLLKVGEKVGEEAEDKTRREGEKPPEAKEEATIEEETHVARSVTFTDTDQDVLLLRLEGGQVNEYINGELERSNLLYFKIDITERTYRDEGGRGRFKDAADVEALKASVEGLFAEALRGGELRQRWVEKVKENWKALATAPEAVKDDHEVVLSAVKVDPRTLELASKRFRGDRSSVLELVRATKAAFLTAWAAEELRSDDAFVAQCRAAVPSGLVWTWHGSYSAPVAMREAFPTAGASIPGGEAYDHVMEQLRYAEHGSTATVWFGDTPVWGHEANKKQWIHPPHACGRHHQPVPPPEGRHPMWDAKIESRQGDEEAEVGSTHPCWCCAWIQEVQKKAAEGKIICCAVSNIYFRDWVKKYGAGSSELSDARAEEFGLRKETFRNGRPEGWGEGVIKIEGSVGGQFSREALVHPRTNLPLGEGCRWERQTLDRMDFPVYAFFNP